MSTTPQVRVPAAPCLRVYRSRKNRRAVR